MATIKETLLVRVNDIRQGMNSLKSSDFGDAFFWQEVGSLADKECKKAWTKLQDPAGKAKLPDDDAMRDLGAGDHSVTSSKLFTVTAKIAEPKKTLDMEMFIDELVRRHKIQPEKLVALVELCKREGKPALTKRVVENVR